MASPGSVSEYGAPGNLATNDQLLAINGQKRSPAFQNPGGLAGVGQKKIRDSIFNAIKRRETFATSGPRIIPRFFSSWDSMENWCEDLNLYQKLTGAAFQWAGILKKMCCKHHPLFSLSHC